MHDDRITVGIFEAAEISDIFGAGQYQCFALSYKRLCAPDLFFRQLIIHTFHLLLVYYFAVQPRRFMDLCPRAAR